MKSRCKRRSKEVYTFHRELYSSRESGDSVTCTIREKNVTTKGERFFRFMSKRFWVEITEEESFRRTTAPFSYPDPQP